MRRAFPDCPKKGRRRLAALAEPGTIAEDLYQAYAQDRTLPYLNISARAYTAAERMGRVASAMARVTPASAFQFEDGEIGGSTIQLYLKSLCPQSSTASLSLD